MQTEGDDIDLKRQFQDAVEAEIDAQLEAASAMLAALQELSDVARAYLAHMDADDIVALEAAHAAIAAAKAAGIKAGA